MAAAQLHAPNFLPQKSSDGAMAAHSSMRIGPPTHGLAKIHTVPTCSQLLTAGLNGMLMDIVGAGETSCAKWNKVHVIGHLGLLQTTF